MSAIALIPDADRAEGIRRLEHDLANGDWHRRWGDLLDRAPNSTSGTGSSWPDPRQETCDCREMGEASQRAIAGLV